VSRRWDLLRPAIKKAVTGFIPAPRDVLGAGTALVDGTIAPTWDWKHIPDLFSAKDDMAGMNIQVAATLVGDVAAVGPFAVHAARHDAHAFDTSGLKDILAGTHAAADLGHRRRGHRGHPVQEASWRRPGRSAGGIQRSFRQDPCRRRACHRASENLKDA
jgi:hypothetical protein